MIPECQSTCISFYFLTNFPCTTANTAYGFETSFIIQVILLFLISLASSVLLTSHQVECCYIFILRSFRGLTCAKFKLLCQMWICRFCTSKVYPTLCDFILCCLQCLTLWDFIVNSKNWRGPQFRNLARKAEMSFFGCTG